MIKTTAFAAALFAATLAQAATLTFVSEGGYPREGNGSIFATIGGDDILYPVNALDPNPAWVAIPGAEWVSPLNTGNPADPGFELVPNETPFLFSHYFDLAGVKVTNARVRALADDRAAGWLNGTKLFSSGRLPRENCVTTAPGCRAETMLDITLDPALFFAGTNFFELETQQLFGSSAGGAWRIDLEVERLQSPVPEPGTYMLFGAGFCLIALARRRIARN